MLAETWEHPLAGLSDQGFAELRCLSWDHDWVALPDDGVVECQCCEAIIETPFISAVVHACELCGVEVRREGTMHPLCSQLRSARERGEQHGC